MTWNGLVVCREPQAVVPSNVLGDPSGVWLVELADVRHLVKWVAANTLYNVSSNATDGSGGPGIYLPASLATGTISAATNASPIVISSADHGLITGASVTITGALGNTAANGTFIIVVIDADTFSLTGSTGNGVYASGGVWTSPWSWSTMTGNLWGLMSTQLGAFPGLPFTPNGIPTGWMAQGVSAWDVLGDVVQRIGCAIRADLTQPVGSQFTIIQVGAADSTADAAIALALQRNQKIHDAEFMTISRGKVPFGVAVQFHQQQLNPTQIPPFLQDTGPYVVNVAGGIMGAEPGIYQPLWDDLPALFNGITLTNGTALTARANERAADYFRRKTATGGMLLWQRFSGLVSIAPGATIRSVSWRSAGSGCYTDVARHAPEDMPQNDYASGGTVQDLVRLGFPSDSGVSICDGITLTEEQTRCEDGKLNIYARDVILNTVEGCLEKTVGLWSLVRTEGSCAAAENIVINYSTINDFTTYVQNQTYFNSYDNNLYINVNNIWYVYCLCGSGSGSGSGSGPGSWYCIQTVIPDLADQYRIQTVSMLLAGLVRVSLGTAQGLAVATTLDENRSHRCCRFAPPPLP